MIRGAVLTLGTIAVLGGVGAAQGDEFFWSGWPMMWPSLSSMTDEFPRLPENWSDLPLQFHLSESAGYNSNITNTPTGPGLSAVYGRPIGALQTISNYGVSFKNEVGAHQLFADANWGMYRYANQDRFNTAHSSVDLGDNFTVGSKCKGSLKFSETSSPSIPGQQVQFNAINTTTTTSFTENAKCLINGEFAGIFNSGTSTSNNTAELDKQNDYRSVFVAAGMSYSISETNSLQVLATVTGTDYTDRQAAIVNQQNELLSKLTTDEVMATYTKNFGPNIALNAQLGAVGVRDAYFEFGVPRTILPEYALSVQWAVTPKLTLNAAASRLASPPTSIITNLQITESASAGFAYHWTPKITVSGSLQTSYASGATSTADVGQVLTSFTANQRTSGVNAGVAYVITPFLAANLSYQFNKSVQSTRTTTNNLVMLALNFNPY